jgi:hypothetical protein
VPATQKRAPTKPDNTQTGLIELRQVDLVFFATFAEAMSIMKPKQILISILPVLFVFPLIGTFAQQAPNSVSIRVITTFDYPGTGNLTEPSKINDGGDIVGIYLDSSLVSRGFIRFNNGKFSAPIVEPNDTGNLTQGRGINNSRTVCGDYIGSDSFDHGFFLSGSTLQNTIFPARSPPLCLG